MTDLLIKNFKQIYKSDTQIAGGKGASLGEMTQIRIPVPEGFVILSNAFDKLIEETDLNVEIDAVLEGVDIQNIQTVENASEKIHELILSKEMPEDIMKEIIESYQKLGANFVAVRSSATSEDSASAAWAGQLESYINTTEKTLLDNIKKCWASLFTPRAIFYRFEKKLNKDKISVAVIIQKMVQPQKSGIAFSVHPVTQDENQIIIEAGFGLGEAIVSGAITPDSYVVDKQGFKILDINVNEQNKALYKKSRGGNEWKELGEKGKKQVLTKKEIIELSKLIVKIEDHYGFPCDIEWIKEKEKFYIVQSRPITTLQDNAQDSKYTPTIVSRFKDYIGEKKLFVLRGNFIPLFCITDWLKFYDKKFKKKRNVYPVLSIKKGDFCIHYINFDKYLDISRDGIQRYIDDSKFMKNINSRYNKVKRKINNLYERYMLEECFNDKNLINKLKKAEENLHEVVALTLFIDFLDSQILEKVFKDNKFYLDFEKIYEVSNIYDFQSFDLINNIEILKWHKKNKRYLKHIFTGYSSVVTDKDLEKNLSKLNINKLKIIIKKAESQIKIKKEEKNKLRCKLNTKEKFVADFLSWISKIRDDRKILMNKMDAIFYDSVYNLYKNWGLDPNLAENSYVFEVLKGKKSVIKNIKKVQARAKNVVNIYYGGRKYLEKYKNLNDEFKDSKLLEEPVKNTKMIKGQVANKGIVRGLAKIIFNPNKNHSFMEGNILITSMTRPEFVPVMKKASAIITNEGGITCHAAIMSRELNIPCVIGTKNATEILHDGDFIEVDAIKGIIKILDHKSKL